MTSSAVWRVSKGLRQLLDCQLCLLCGQPLWQEPGRLPAWLANPSQPDFLDLSQLSFWLCPSCMARLPLRTEGWQCMPYSGVPLGLVFNYEDPIRQGFLDLKFSGKRLVADLLALCAAYRLRQLGYRPQGLIPLPLGKKRIKQRGYNQSELICRSLAPLLGAEVLTSALLRSRETQPQTQMKTYKARQANVRDAFALKPNFDLRFWQGRPLLLLDDIYTSGASLGEGAKILWQADLNIRALALARQAFSTELPQSQLNKL